jgi:hypothetical protein
MQLIPNLINLGFNQPYSFENVKKSIKTQSISFDKRKYNYDHTYNSNSFKYHLNKNSYDKNQDYIFDDESEKKFKRKMTKAEKTEINKWFEARKKLYPTQKNIELKKKIGDLKVEKGLISNLELKLRKKVNILKKLNSSKQVKRKFLNQNNKSNIIKDNNVIENKLDEKEKINKEEKSLPEDGEINEEKNNYIVEQNSNFECKNDGGKKMLGKKRGFIKKLKTKKNNNIINAEDNNKENNFKKGFKYKVNHLYDDLIKKDKIKEQNIILQAIHYLINIKNEEKNIN